MHTELCFQINEELAKVGKGPVGFVNPALYENPWVLNDITSGPNPNCGTDGFPAVQGWVSRLEKLVHNEFEHFD